MQRFIFKKCLHSLASNSFFDSINPTQTACALKNGLEARLAISHLLSMNYVSTTEEVQQILNRLILIFPSGLMIPILHHLSKYIYSKALSPTKTLADECLACPGTQLAFFVAYLHSNNSYEKPLILRELLADLTALRTKTKLSHHFRTFPGEMLISPKRYHWSPSFFCAFFFHFSKYRIKHGSAVPTLADIIVKAECTFNICLPEECYRWAIVQSSSSRDCETMLGIYARAKSKFLFSSDPHLKALLETLVRHFALERDISALQLFYDEINECNPRERSSTFLSMMAISLVGAFCRLLLFPQLLGTLLLVKMHHAAMLKDAVFVVAKHFGCWKLYHRNMDFLQFLLSLSEEFKLDFIAKLPMRSILDISDWNLISLFQDIYPHGEKLFVNKEFANNVIEAAFHNPHVVRKLFPQVFNVGLGKLLMRAKLLLSPSPSFCKYYWAFVFEATKNTPLAPVFYSYYCSWGHGQDDLSIEVILSLLKCTPLLDKSCQLNEILLQLFLGLSEDGRLFKFPWTSSQLFPIVASVFILDHRWHLLATLFESVLESRGQCSTTFSLMDVHSGMKTSRHPNPKSNILTEESNRCIWSIFRLHSDDILSICLSAPMRLLPESMSVDAALSDSLEGTPEKYLSEIRMWCSERHISLIRELRAYTKHRGEFPTGLDAISEVSMLGVIHIPNLFIQIRDKLFEMLLQQLKEQ